MLQKVFPVTYDKLKFFADIFNVNSKVYSTFDIWKWVDGWNKFIQARRKARLDIIQHNLNQHS